MNKFTFSDESVSTAFDDNHQLKKLVDSASWGQWVVGGGLWLISALLTFGFGFVNMGALFSPIFATILPNFATTLGAIIGGAFLVFTFDIGALNALRVHIYGAMTLEQKDITKRVFYVDFIGSIVASLAQMTIGLSGVLVNLSAAWQSALSWSILLCTLLVFSFNVWMAFQYYLNSVEVIEAKHITNQRMKDIELRHKAEEAQRQIEAHIKETEVQNTIDTLTAVNEKYKEQLAARVGVVAKNKLDENMKRFDTQNNLNQADVMAFESPPLNVEVVAKGDNEENFPQPPSTN